MTYTSAVAAAFAHRFGKAPAWVVRAPGRVNLIGDHTDYNGGFVLPMAIDRWVSIALAPRTDRLVRIASLDLEETAEFSLAALGPRGSGWLQYVKGTAWSLAEGGLELAGWEGIVSGDVPRGAGLSSSAAFEMAVARAFAAVSGFAWEPVAMALACQRAENDWVGVGCGIMDQLISGCGREGHAILLDCRSLDAAAVPLPAALRVLVLDTATRRSLAHSGYNDRREECEEAAAACGVAVLRDVAAERLDSMRARLDALHWRRLRHVVTENARTLAAAEALRRGDAVAMGQLMNASHASLRFDFDVSTSALDAMAAAASEAPGCYGARMMGGGFGGCVVALVAAEAAGAVQKAAFERFRTETGLVPRAYLCRASGGAEQLERFIVP